MTRSASGHMTNSVLLVFAVVIFGCTCACVSDEANRFYGDEHYPAKSPEQVEVLERNPKRAFKVIADFQARGDSFESLRKKAAAIGADAVIVRDLGGLYDTRDVWAGQDREKGVTASRVVGTAIRYTKE